LGATARDGSEPTAECGGGAKSGKVAHGLEKNVLREIVNIVVRDAREKNSVDHANVAGVEAAEGWAISATSCGDIASVVVRTARGGNRIGCVFHGRARRNA